MFKGLKLRASLCACTLIATAAAGALLVGDVAEAQQAKAKAPSKLPLPNATFETRSR